jgi:dephospho-CoA kinase
VSPGSWPLHFSRRRWKRGARFWPFLTIGLTGSIAMGKSTTAAMLRRFGWPVFDADAAVHRLMGAGGAAVPGIKVAFPHVVSAAGVDRQALGQAVFGNTAALRRLENIVHPMVAAARHRFLMQAGLHRVPAVVLDVPLLFEGGSHQTVDVVVVTSAPAFLQRQRAMARKGMTADRLKGILARQLPDHTKRRQAFVVVPTGLGKREALRRLTPLRHLAGRSPA